MWNTLCTNTYTLYVHSTNTECCIKDQITPNLIKYRDRQAKYIFQYILSKYLVLNTHTYTLYTQCTYTIKIFTMCWKIVLFVFIYICIVYTKQQQAIYM